MTNSRQRLELELDDRIDAWHAGGGDLLDLADAANAAGQVEELTELLEVADLVAAYGADALVGAPTASPAGARATAPDLWLDSETPQPPATRTIGRSNLLRIAAAVLLVAGLSVGVSLALAGHQPAGNPAPVQGGPPMPAALMQDVESNAGFWGDPYPSKPVLWVKTTIGRLRTVDHGRLANFGRKDAASAVIFVAELRGRFYDHPATRSGVFTEVWELLAPTPIATFGNDAVPPHPLSTLAALGTVHAVQLVAPPTQPPLAALPPSLATTFETDARANHDPYPADPVSFVETTVGDLRQHVGSLDWPALANAAAATPMWVASYDGDFPGGGHGVSGEGLWILGIGPEASPEYSWLGTPQTLSSLAGQGGLASLGSVHEAWIAPPLRPSLPALTWPSVTSDLMTRSSFSHIRMPRTVSGIWVETSLAALESAVKPQVNTSWAAFPGNTPVWIIVLGELASASGIPGRSDWLVVTTARPGSTAAVPWMAAGGSPLFGITQLGQLGAVHHVTFHLADGQVTSATG